MSDEEPAGDEPESGAIDETSVATKVRKLVRKRRFSLRRNGKTPDEKKPKNDKPVAVKASKQVYEPLSLRIWIALLVVASVVVALLVLVLTTFS